MEPLETRLDGLGLIRPDVHRDRRGFVLESYRREVYDAIGIESEFVQDNRSRSGRGVVRGMHFQSQPGMAKLISCSRGAIFDVAVDLRRGSPTFGQWEGFDLNDENHHQLYCPIGFAHGFCVTSEVADVAYKCSSYYEASAERSIAYDDPDVGVAWPSLELRSSERDAEAPRLSEVEPDLPFAYH